MRKSEKFFIGGIFMMIIPFLGFVLWSYWLNVDFTPEELEKWDMQGKRVLVITPMLTAIHDSCVREPCEIIRDVQTDASQKEAISRFLKLRSGMVTDLDLINNTRLLSFQKTVIVLDNAYITQNVYDAIRNHDNVIYLYPNSLSHIVDVSNGTMKTVSGFDGSYQNCTEWDTREVPSGIKMKCVPTVELWKNDKSIWDFITSKS